MKMIAVVALALVAAVAAAPVEEPATIIRSDFNQQPDGSFVSAVETSNGIVTQTTGELKSVVGEDGKEHLVIVLRGSYQYPRDDGTVENISYQGDETGFHADGPSIPVAPARR